MHEVLRISEPYKLASRTFKPEDTVVSVGDVRIGGGPTIVRDFLAAGLVDYMHAAVVPILLGRGVRLWDGLEGLSGC